MDAELLQKLRAAQQELDPQFSKLRAATGALQSASKLASEETLDALTMQKALVKLEEANQALAHAGLQAATAAFAATTNAALDALAFEFARDLKHVFEARGQSVEGRPPTLVVDQLVLNIDIAKRKAQWFYGKEALTSPIPLSINAILKAYDAQRKTILDRKIDVAAFVAELQTAWQQMVDEKAQQGGRKAGNTRVNLVEAFSKVVLNRQSPRFWNAPARSNFKDYERPLFVRDLVLAHSDPTTTVDGKSLRLRLGGATKSQAESASRSIWLPSGALGGEYYADLTFEES